MLPNLTRTGRILLQSVPIPVAQVVARVCASYDVETYRFPEALDLTLSTITDWSGLRYCPKVFRQHLVERTWARMPLVS